LEVACARTDKEEKRTDIAKQSTVRPLRDKNRLNPDGDDAAV